MARTSSRFSQHRETKAAVSEPAPAPASSRRTVLGSGPNREAMKSATGVAVRNCPSSSWRLLGFSKAAIFMSSCYQAEFRFAIEQAGIVRKIERVMISAETETDGGIVSGDLVDVFIHADVAVHLADVLMGELDYFQIDEDEAFEALVVEAVDLALEFAFRPACHAAFILIELTGVGLFHPHDGTVVGPRKLGVEWGFSGCFRFSTQRIA